jgi:guanylate kinase
MKRSDALVECAETYTESYGIPRSVLAGLCDRALILTGGSALALRQRLPNSISIFIQPASAAAAAERILDRNCPNSEYRIAGYEQEVAASSQFDRVFLNAKISIETLDQIEEFYLSARRLNAPRSPRAHL